MPLVRRYRNLHTDLSRLYDGILKKLRDTAALDISSEVQGEIKGKMFASITATRKTVPKAFIGALREVTCTITGEPDDFLVEIHAGSWFTNLIIPATGDLLVSKPLEGIATAKKKDLIARDFQMRLAEQIRELITKHSKVKLTLDKIQTFW